MDRADITLTQFGILLLTFIRTGSCLSCQVCQYYKHQSSLKSMVTYMQGYDNVDCIQNPKMSNFSTDCLQAPNSTCLKITGNFKLHHQASKEVGNVDLVIRGCSYTLESKDCVIFPNESDIVPATVNLLVKFIESSNVYYVSGFSGRHCLCDVNNCNASERLTNRAYVISSMMLFVFLATFNSYKLWFTVNV